MKLIKNLCIDNAKKRTSILIFTLILITVSSCQNSEENKLPNGEVLVDNENKLTDEADKNSIKLYTQVLTDKQFDILSSYKDGKKLIFQFSFTRSKIVFPNLIVYISEKGRKRIINPGNPEILTINKDSGFLIPPFNIGDQEVRINKLRKFIQNAQKDPDYKNYKILLIPTFDEVYKSHVKFKFRILGNNNKEALVDFTTNPSPPKGAEDDVDEPDPLKDN